MKITSAYANKMLKSLTEDKDYWASKELSSNTYVAAVGEEPVIPDYDYAAVAATIEKIDQKIVKIKHALNLANATAKIMVGNTEMSVDSILVRLPKARENSRSYTSRNAAPEYRYINYDLELVKQDYERISREIMEMQIALDRYNQTILFEVEL